jgi:benzodiazapine receptor
MMSTASTQRWLMLAAFLLAAFAAAGLGGYATAESVTTWYPTLIKPSWNPPAWIFGPVWTLLYVLMSVAAWRIWLRRDRPDADRALALFFIQLGLNALWSVLFFGLQSPGLALIDVIILWLLLFSIRRRFRSIDPIAGWLWLPYLLWVSFATVLNATIVWLNR